MGGTTTTTTTTTNTIPLRPVVLFFPGGAWQIGHKMWAALTARVLTHFGIVTVVADYRNDPFYLFFGGLLSCLGTTTTTTSTNNNYDYPQIPDMVDDVMAAIEWTTKHIAEFGGDPNRIILVGQSAGGHLAMTALLQRAMQVQQQQQQQQEQQGQNEPQQEQQHEQQSPPSCKDDVPSTTTTRTKSSSTTTTTRSITWRPCDLCGLVSVSAPYHFPIMDATFQRHGLSKAVLKGMFSQNNQNPNDYDPLVLVQRQQEQQENKSNVGPPPPPPLELPPIQIWHGLRDATVPWQSAETFGNALNKALLLSSSSSPSLSNNNHNKVVIRLFPSWTHTDAILEGPMSGRHEFHKQLFDIVHEWSVSSSLSSPTLQTAMESFNNEDNDKNINKKDDDDDAASPIITTSSIPPEWDDKHVVLQPMWCPTILAQLARFFIPF